MIKETITYTDYNGVERTEDFYFNLTKAEVTEMQLQTEGGLSEMIERIVKAQDVPQIVGIFKTIILKAYGVKSADGRRFIKNDQLRDEFSQTEAYSQLYMTLATDADKAADFVNGVLPNMDSITPVTNK